MQPVRSRIRETVQKCRYWRFLWTCSRATGILIRIPNTIMIGGEHKKIHTTSTFLFRWSVLLLPPFGIVAITFTIAFMFSSFLGFSSTSRVLIFGPHVSTIVCSVVDNKTIRGLSERILIPRRRWWCEDYLRCRVGVVSTSIRCRMIGVRLGDTIIGWGIRSWMDRPG